jgi:gamma-glutamyltranspeptidase
VNERIKELLNVCGMPNEDLMEIYSDINKSFYMEKFAELIVRECMEVAIHKDDGMISTADIAGYMAAGRANAAKMIAKHFGAE